MKRIIELNTIKSIIVVAAIAFCFQPLISRAQNLSPPVITAPNNGALITTNPLTFSWLAVANAVAYQYEIAYDEDFYTDFELTTVQNTSYNLPLSTGSYFWRIRTQSSGGQFGPWSATYQFEVDYGSAQLLSVNPGSGNQGQILPLSISGLNIPFNQSTPTIEFEFDNNAGYSFSFDSNPTEQFNGTDFEFSASSNIAIPLAAPTGLYDLIYTAPDATIYSLPISFEVLDAQPVPDAPTLLTPSNGSVISNFPISFSWTSSPLATDYQFQIANDVNFNSVVESQLVQTNSFSTSVGIGDYHWRVRGKSAFGYYGDWSSVFEFSVEYGSPQLTSINPDSAYQGQGLTVTISGVNVPFDQSTATILFELEGNGTTIPFYASPSEQFDGNNFIFTATGGLGVPENTPIGLYDLNYLTPSQQPLSLVQSFTVLPELAAPTAPTLISPVGNPVLSNNNTNFTWSEPNLTDRYRIEISSDPGFTQIVTSQVVQNASFSQTLSDGQYYWRVQARNLSAIWGAWSPSESFSIDNVTLFTGISPDNSFAGVENLQLSISGVNLPFTQSTATTQSLIFDQNGYQFSTNAVNTTSSTSGYAQVDVPLAAPVGYYDVTLDDSSFDSWLLPNGFYVNSGNEFSGFVYIDYNGNEVYDTGDVPYQFGLIEVNPIGVVSAIQSNGSYSGNLPTGNHTVTVQSPPYYASEPTQHNANFTASGSSLSGLDFALQPIPGMIDMRILLNSGSVRPNQSTTLQVVIQNVGTTTESGEVTVDFPAGYTFQLSSVPYVLSGNSITIPYSNVSPNQELVAEVQFGVPLSYQAGDVLVYEGAVNNLPTDQDLSNNNYDLYVEVVNSYDPNIKQVNPLNTITQSFVDGEEYLDYTIYFQNTGTAPAIDVYILDTISSLLQINTFDYVTASHNCEVNFLNDRIIEFRFEDIFLPDSTSNPEESIGFVSFRMKPVSNLGEGEYIDNRVNIYFDFNLPIVTNTTRNWIPLDVSRADVDEFELQVYPNPSSGVFTVNSDNISEFRVYDPSGRLVMKNSPVGNRFSFDLSGFSEGVYVLELVKSDAVLRKKLIFSTVQR